MELETIQKLARLARLELKDAEAEDLRRELSSILTYVGEIEKAGAPASPDAPALLETVTREDTVYETPLASREELLDASMLRKGDYIEVQPIFKP